MTEGLGGGTAQAVTEELPSQPAEIPATKGTQIAGEPAIWMPLIVDKPLVCQRGLPGRLQIKDLRPATGTGMHFSRKCKHLLCKKCQK